MEKQKENKQTLDQKLLLIVHALRPYEVIKIKKDEFGNPKKIIVMTESTTTLEYSD